MLRASAAAAATQPATKADEHRLVIAMLEAELGALAKKAEERLAETALRKRRIDVQHDELIELRARVAAAQTARDAAQSERARILAQMGHPPAAASRAAERADAAPPAAASLTAELPAAASAAAASASAAL